VTLFLVGRRSILVGKVRTKSPPPQVSWNINSCVTLANMQKLDLVLGSAILAVLFAVMISGIIYSVV
jgi:hypothetical protein